MGVHEIGDAKLILNFGYNGADSHPIIQRQIIRAKQNGAEIICVDPRRIETARISDLHLQLKGGTNLALVNALAYVIIEEKLYDEEFVAAHTSGFDGMYEVVKKYTPEYASEITGVPAADIVKAARMYAGAESAMILYGMGVCQFGQAVDVVKSLANLIMLTGNVGKPASGIGPVRGQNNVQGACDMGALPNSLPGYQSLDWMKITEKFELLWECKMPTKPGLHLSRVPEKVLEEPDINKRIHAYYIFGEDPAQSDPDLAEVRETLEKIDFVVVQDIYMNKTAQLADVVLPGTAWGEYDGVFSSCDRGFQRVRKVVEPIPGVLEDWEIICRVASAMGYPMRYSNSEEIWEEVLQLCPDFAGATYDKMEENGSVQWPCRKRSDFDIGTTYLHKGGRFESQDGRGRFWGADWRPPYELENEEFPLSFTTVREVGHYSVRTMTGNCRMLASLEDEPGWIQMSLEDCEELGIKEGELVKVINKRGWCITRCLPTPRVRKGATYMTYQWWIGACNELTTGKNLDPYSKTPEYKYCNCRVEKMHDQEWAENFLLSEYRELREKMGIKCIGEQKVLGTKPPESKDRKGCWSCE